MQSISVGYGKVTFSTSSATLSGFVVDAPFVRTLTSKKLPKVGSTMRIPVSAHPDIDGWLFQDTVNVEDGTICLVQMSFKFRGSGLRDGAIFIRTRKDGQGLLVKATLPHDPRSTLSTNKHTVFAGAGDILTIEDLDKLGITPPGNFVSAFMDEDEIAECFDITVTSEAKSEPPIEETHETPEGRQVKLRIDRNPRRMRIRK